jgi:hypothetical protein
MPSSMAPAWTKSPNPKPTATSVRTIHGGQTGV